VIIENSLILVEHEISNIVLTIYKDIVVLFLVKDPEAREIGQLMLCQSFVLLGPIKL
jgi:hypothetical protein